MTALKALVFDVDGTLADTEETHRRAFNSAFEAFGLDYAWDVDAYEELLRVTGGKERLVHWARTLDAPESERDRLLGLIPAVHRTKTEHYTRLVASGGAPLRPGVRRLIREAEAAGIALAIASTTTAANIDALLEAELGPRADGTPALARFSVIACGDMVPAKKPAPDIYLRALEALGIDATQAIAFEDSEMGIAAAKSAGLFTVATPVHWSRRHDLSAADLEVPHLGDPETPLTGQALVRAHGPFVTLQGLCALFDGASGRSVSRG